MQPGFEVDRQMSDQESTGRSQDGLRPANGGKAALAMGEYSLAHAQALTRYSWLHRAAGLTSGMLPARAVCSAATSSHSGFSRQLGRRGGPDSHHADSSAGAASAKSSRALPAMRFCCMVSTFGAAVVPPMHALLTEAQGQIKERPFSTLHRVQTRCTLCPT